MAARSTQKMDLLLVLSIMLLSAVTIVHPTEALHARGHLLKTATFLSPPFFLRPGSVANKYYHGIPFPGGHIALKSFNAEVVDDAGAAVPLHETYLHHWVVEPYYVARNSSSGCSSSGEARRRPRFISARNSGVCKNTLGQYYGLGSETRHTATWVPDPYGIIAGEVLDGYEQKWLLNVHAIDTRGVVDRLGCTECKCSLYNVTVDEHGRAIAEDYDGGLYCCYDQTRCRLREGYNGETRRLFLQYTVQWLDWVDDVVPVNIYIFDVTDTSLQEGRSESACKIEYKVKGCSTENQAKNECVDVKMTKQALPRGGDIVYGVAHQHSGGIGASLHGQDGRLLCASIPTYGEGEEAGNEANYIVGMSTCYPTPGTVGVGDGEILTIVSNYSSDRAHTGVMGLFYILVAEPRQPAQSSLCFRFPVPWCLPAWLSSKV